VIASSVVTGEKTCSVSFFAKKKKGSRCGRAACENSVEGEGGVGAFHA